MRNMAIALHFVCAMRHVKVVFSYTKELSLAGNISIAPTDRRIHSHTDSCTRTRTYTLRHTRDCPHGASIRDLCCLRQQLEIHIETRRTGMWNRRVKKPKTESLPCPAAPPRPRPRPRPPPTARSLQIKLNVSSLNDNSNRARGNYRHWGKVGVAEGDWVGLLKLSRFSFQYAL